jgi:hypothetical protein
MNQHHATTPGERIISIDAILDVIFSFSNPRTIITLSKTCRAARPIAASYFRVAYKPEYLLRRFLPDPAGVWAFRALQSETGVAIFGRAACNFLARAPLTDAVMNLYVDRSYAAVVSDFFTQAGYEVEMREHEFVFFRMGEDEQVAREVVLHVSPPDSFDSVDKPRTLPSGAWCTGAVPPPPPPRATSLTQNRLLQSSLTSLRSTGHIPFFRPNTTRRRSESPRLRPSRLWPT